jgi:hypothetical protein
VRGERFETVATRLDLVGWEHFAQSLYKRSHTTLQIKQKPRDSLGTPRRRLANKQIVNDPVAKPICVFAPFRLGVVVNFPLDLLPPELPITLAEKQWFDASFVPHDGPRLYFGHQRNRAGRAGRGEARADVPAFWQCR